MDDADRTDPDALRASVIVPMLNARAHVMAQVTALMSQSIPTREFEVIWVDNGSTDGTAELVERAIAHTSHMRVIAAPDMRTSFHARNVGAGVARASRFLFCDSDDVVDTNWVAAMINALAEDDVVGGSLEFALLNSGADVPQTTTLEVRHGFLPASPTANLGIAREVFRSLGGFRESYLSGQDFGLCWRAQLAGFSIGFAPNAVVHYRLRPSRRRRFARQFRFGQRHRAWVSEFVEAGAEDLRPATVVKRIGVHGWDAIAGPARRQSASAAAWHLGVLYSFVRSPQVKTR